MNACAACLQTAPRNENQVSPLETPPSLRLPKYEVLPFPHRYTLALVATEASRMQPLICGDCSRHSAMPLSGTAQASYPPSHVRPQALNGVAVQHVASTCRSRQDLPSVPFASQLVRRSPRRLTLRATRQQYHCARLRSFADLGTLPLNATLNSTSTSFILAAAVYEVRCPSVNRFHEPVSSRRGTAVHTLGKPHRCQFTLLQSVCDRRMPHWPRKQAEGHVSPTKRVSG